jgi:hypothetical protein
LRAACANVYSWPHLAYNHFEKANLDQGFGDGPIPVNTFSTEPQLRRRLPFDTSLVSTPAGGRNRIASVCRSWKKTWASLRLTVPRACTNGSGLKRHARRNKVSRLVRLHTCLPFPSTAPPFSVMKENQPGPKRLSSRLAIARWNA